MPTRLIKFYLIKKKIFPSTYVGIQFKNHCLGKEIMYPALTTLAECQRTHTHRVTHTHTHRYTDCNTYEVKIKNKVIVIFNHRRNENLDKSQGNYFLMLLYQRVFVHSIDYI